MKRSHEQFENPYMNIMGISAEDTLCINDVQIRPQPLKFISYKDPYEGCVTIPFIQRKETVENDLFIIDKILLNTIENEIQSLDSDKEELDKKELKIIDAIVVEPVNKFHTYACSECIYTTNHISRIKSHEKIHQIKKKYTCNTCGFLAKEKRTFKNHQETHKNKIKYACLVGGCDVHATTRRRIEIHWHDKHGKNREGDIPTHKRYTEIKNAD
jgi:hypothetical protein